LVHGDLDTGPPTGLECTVVKKNQHRWKGWIEDQRVDKLMENLAGELKHSWKRDKKNPQSFPVNTWWLFVQIEEELKNEPDVRSGIKVASALRPPRNLSDLIAERTIKGAFEDHNENSYEDALKLAARGQGEGYAAWRKIRRALDVAYVILYYGVDFAPKPKVHFLHRKLLEIAESEHLRGLNLEGIVEFFDDVCPCGKNHQADALRKLRKRIANLQRTILKE
jgi:hypothetical protein